MASLGSSSSGLWSALGQASNVAQLVGVDALGLASMIVQAALVARRHRDACRRLAQHVEIVGGLLKELELADLMRREVTRRPLDQLRGALRRCYALVRACQDCGYLRGLLVGAWMAGELRAVEHEIDMFIRLIPLIALVDAAPRNRVTHALDGVPGVNVITDTSNHPVRFPTSVLDSTQIHVQGADELSSVTKRQLAGAMDLQEQKILDTEELIKLCTHTEESFPGFKKFEFDEIVDATDNFSANRNVGYGGFAKVYKGLLSDGCMIAVKRYDEHATVLDFRNEILISRLQHTNLIRLLGWCIHGKERILVYEFMNNGSLDRFIFDEGNGMLLDWSKRFNIIKGLAKGLVYLHKNSDFWIVHRDLKPKNILLDSEMVPKITDFGSARTLSSDAAEERTNRVVGTRGYKAPEYAFHGIYSAKTDVFSFGVLALAIISGRKNTILEQQGDTVGSLVRDAYQLWKDGRLHELVDPDLGDGYELDEITQCAQVALLCAQEDPADRPTMSDVVALLNSGSRSVLSDPKEPSELIKGGSTGDRRLSTSVSQSSRTIDITITSSAPVSTRVRIILDSELGSITVDSGT